MENIKILFEIIIGIELLYSEIIKHAHIWSQIDQKTSLTTIHYFDFDIKYIFWLIKPSHKIVLWLGKSGEFVKMWHIWPE